MDTITTGEACGSLDELLDRVTDSHEPVLIAGERAAAVLVSEEDWRALHETLALCSAPGVRESIVEGMAVPVDQCKEGLDW